MYNLERYHQNGKEQLLSSSEGYSAQASHAVSAEGELLAETHPSPSNLIQVCVNLDHFRKNSFLPIGQAEAFC